MRAKVKSARRKASKLHGSTAGYVSIVDRGAAETPFALVKSAEGMKAMGLKKRKTAKSYKQVQTGRKTTGEEAVRKETLIAKFVLDPDVFENENAVLDFLQKSDWEVDDISVEETDEGFVARDASLTDDDFERIDKMSDTGEEGVEAYIGVRVIKEDDGDEPPTKATKDDDAALADADDADDDTDDDDDAPTGEADADDDADDDDEGDEPVAKKRAPAKAAKKSVTPKKKPATKLSKRAERIQKRREAKEAAAKVSKFDAWDAKWGGANTLAKSLKDGMEWDGTPPGFYEVQAAFNGVVMNIVGDEGMDASAKQEALNKSALEFAQVIGGLDSYFDAYINASADTVQNAFSKAERTAIEKWADDWADFLATIDDGDEAAKAPVKKKASADVQSTAPDFAEIISKALAPLQERVEEVAGTVEAVASRRPTKKAASPDDTGTGDRERQSKVVQMDDNEWARKRQQKSLLG